MQHTEITLGSRTIQGIGKREIFCNITGWLCIVFLLVLQSGCASKNALIPTPHLYTIGDQPLFEELVPELKSNQLDVLYVTDRKPENDKSGTINYGNKRSNSLAYGSAIIAMGDNYSWDELVAISTQKTSKRSRPAVKVVSVKERGKFPATPYFYRIGGRGDLFELDPAVVAERQRIFALFKADLLQRLAHTPRKEVLVFVHGISYTFDKAVRVVAEGWHFAGRVGVPIAYTWPAGGRGLFGLPNYAYDRESGEFTIFHLKNFLKYLASVEEVEKIHLVSHSRGTDVIMTALRELAIEIRPTTKDPRGFYKLGNVIMIAPDLDFEVSLQRLVAESIGALYERMTIYSNINDKAIDASKILFSSWLRIGAMEWDDLNKEQKEAMQQMANMDFISYQGSIGGSYGHNYFLDNPAVSSDILALLRYGWAPGKENGRPLEHLGGNFWRIDDDYPL